ncbi:MAG TPA: glycoside hydrolase family 30 beta sandwich domain-containing protein [Acidisarcina sp.]
MATKISRALVLIVACLFCEVSSSVLRAQSVHVSAWSSAIDHSLESGLVFQSQSREETDADIRVYDDILPQQIDHIEVGVPSGGPAATTPQEAPPSVDQEADTLIVNPLMAGAKATSSASGSNIDFMLLTQFSRVVRPGTHRVACGVKGTSDIESLAFRNPDGTFVLFTVNHSKSSVSLEAFWKDRLFTYTQASSSIALFTWDPKSQLVSLVPRKPQSLAKGSLTIEAKCSNPSPLSVDLQCESQALSCSIFPVRFTCDSQQDSVILSVTVRPTDKNDTRGIKPGVLTITATPDVGELTTLRVPCCSAGDKQNE